MSFVSNNPRTPLKEVAGRERTPLNSPAKSLTGSTKSLKSTPMKRGSETPLKSPEKNSAYPESVRDRNDDGGREIGKKRQRKQIAEITEELRTSPVSSAISVSGSKNFTQNEPNNGEFVENNDEKQKSKEKATKRTKREGGEGEDYFQLLSVNGIFKVARDCKVVAPIISTMVELSRVLTEQGLESDLKIPQSQMRQDKRKGDKDDNVPAGEWEVQEIVDSGIENDGVTIKYQVHWKGWDDPKDYTWEPKANLYNSWHLVLEYHKKLSRMDEDQAHLNLIKLILLLSRVTEEGAQIDEGLLLKLCQKDLGHTENKNWVRELQKFLKRKCTLALEFLVRGLRGELDSAGALLDTTVRELRIEDTFGSLDGMFEWVDSREEQEDGNKKRLKEINDSIIELNDGPPITIENFVDGAVVPDFKYVKDYEPVDIQYNSNPVIKCTCTDCFETKKLKKDSPFCCWHECPKKPYGKNGALLLDEREPIYECNQSCACSEDCPFKVVSKGRVYQVGLFRTPNERGWGLKALQRIPKGKFIITYTGELIQADERDRRAIEQNRDDATYLMDLDYNPDGEALFAIDAKNVANVSRFINHSCEPNLRVHPCWIHNMDLNLPTIAFFSKDVIEKGKELTFDYNVRKTEENAEKKEQEDYDDGDEPPPVFGCKCGAESCKGFYI